MGWGLSSSCRFPCEALCAAPAVPGEPAPEPPAAPAPALGDISHETCPWLVLLPADTKGADVASAAMAAEEEGVEPLERRLLLRLMPNTFASLLPRPALPPAPSYEG